MGGYLALASQVCGEEDKERGSCYQVAARPIERLFGSLVLDQTRISETEKSSPSEGCRSALAQQSKIGRFLRERLYRR